MPDLDKALRKVAQVIVGGFGTSVTMRKTTASAYSTATHKVTSTPVDTTIKGRLSDYEAHEIVGRVQVGDRKLTIAAADLTYTPRTEDEVVIGNRIYSIEDVASPQATDEAALHIMQIRGGAAAERAFLPTDLSGLVLWLRADTIADRLDGDTVQTWKDESGQGNHMTQATAAKRPIYKTGIVNGKPVVRFDGADDVLAAGDVIEGTSGLSIFAVVKVTAAEGSKAIISKGQHVASESGWSFHESGVDGDLVFRGGEAGNGFVWIQQRDFGSWGSTFHLLGAIYEPSFQQLREASTALGADGSDADVHDANAIVLRIGNVVFENSPLPGDIGEIIVYDRRVIASEVTSLETYLATGWAV